MNILNKKTVVGGVSAIALAIIATVTGIEGGYVNNPLDPGGATNHGITEQVARDHGYTGSMEDLPLNQANEIYMQDYVVKPGFLPLVQIQSALAEEIIDTGVNVGTSRSSRWFQNGLNQLSRGGKDYPQINVDGKIGPQTISTYQALEKVRGKRKACELMIKVIDIQQGNHYLTLGMPAFTVGWIDHRIGNVDPTECTD